MRLKKTQFRLIFLFLGSLLSAEFCLARESAFKLSQWDVKKSLEADLTGDGEEEEVLVASDLSDTSAGPSLIVLAKDGVLSESVMALHPIDNLYSPASFDGFDVSVIRSFSGTTNIMDIQGEKSKVVYPSRPGYKILLRTLEEDNYQYNFNLHFEYSKKSEDMVLSNIFLNYNHSLCDRSLISVSSVEDAVLVGQRLQEFNGPDAFKRLKELRREIQAGSAASTRIMSHQISENFDQAISAYKVKDKALLKDVVSRFIVGPGEGEECPAESYIADKYLFSNNIRWTNDLGFLFEQAGYYREAVALLEAVVAEDPQRIVAYLNLGDSYWAMGRRDKAILMYQKYSALKSDQGRPREVPPRVAERIRNERPE